MSDRPAPETPDKCAICGTSLTDKPRLADLCLTCDFATSYHGDPTLLTQMHDEDGEGWKAEP